MLDAFALLLCLCYRYRDNLLRNDGKVTHLGLHVAILISRALVAFEAMMQREGRAERLSRIFNRHLGSCAVKFELNLDRSQSFVWHDLWYDRHRVGNHTAILIVLSYLSLDQVLLEEERVLHSWVVQGVLADRAR